MIPPLARRFVAGESEATALEHTRRLNERDVGAILNLLGEHYHARPPADRDADTYCQLVEDIAAADVRACVSVKPSQLGLDVDLGVFRANLERIVETANEHGTFVWIDMEDHTTTDVTLDAFETLAREYGDCVGVCVQANLERTPKDLEVLATVPGKVRLVKGAYDPPEDIGYTDRQRVTDAYRDCLEQMFQTFEDGIAVGSHDPAMIDHAAELHDEYGTPYEIQMLMGVREDAQTDLAREREVWQYVPYGEKWLSYFYRRVRERKENALFAARAILSG
jgi:proline dehydrogenase